MKSYLSKLAARATLANVPATTTSSQSKSHDPIADSATDVTAPPSEGLVQTSRAQPRSIETPQTAPAEITEHRSVTRLRRTDSELVSVTENDTESLLPQTIPPATVQLVSEAKLEPSLHFEQSHSRADAADEREPDHELHRLMPQTNDVAKGIAVEALREGNESKQSREAETDQRLTELKRGQDVLMRRADAFMAGIFKHQATTTSAEVDSEKEKYQREPPASPVVSRDYASQLQPATKSTPMRDAANEQQSLVIGNLTVEILPTQPQPIAPPQRLIVVSGGRPGGRGGFQSSHRFGLGQF